MGIGKITDSVAIFDPVVPMEVPFQILPLVLFQSGPVVCVESHINHFVALTVVKCFFGRGRRYFFQDPFPNDSLAVLVIGSCLKFTRLKLSDNLTPIQ